MSTLKTKTLGPVADLEKHLPHEWWRSLFNSIYLKTDGDVVENDANTKAEVDALLSFANLPKDARILDLCCGQGRHVFELVSRGFLQVAGLDRSRYLIRLARKRALKQKFNISFSEGDARKIHLPENSLDVVTILGNSYGYFEREEDDLAVLQSIMRILKSEGILLMDIVNGEWMKSNFEKRSWEWIDQNHFVCRERTLAKDNKRIIAREVVTHAEKGVIADQFYAERLYTKDEIIGILHSLNFTQIECCCHIETLSDRNQDLGMMANRLLIKAIAPIKKAKPTKQRTKLDICVLMGDPSLSDEVKKDGKFNDEDFATIQKLKLALKTIGDFQFNYLDNHLAMIQKLINHKPAFVFNLCDEGYGNDPTKELHIPSLLELLNIPYTGAGPQTLALCYNKNMVRAIAESLNIPVPMETFVDKFDQVATIPSIFPALIKPNYGDSSVGITATSVVRNSVELINQVDELKNTLGESPFLIQEFLSGEEYSVGIIGNPGDFHVLPLMRVNYSDLPAELPQILGYESKWHPDSPYWNAIKYEEVKLQSEMHKQMIDHSLLLFERLECRDYARFDFRADAEGVIKLLEVNPNPGWCWDGKLNMMAEYASITYAELLYKILNAAISRNRLSIDGALALA